MPPHVQGDMNLIEIQRDSLLGHIGLLTSATLNVGRPLVHLKGVTVDNKPTIAIGIGALLLLVNLGLAVTGFVDGLIEGVVEEQVTESMDEQADFDAYWEDEDGNAYPSNWSVSTGERVYFAYSITDETALSSDDPSQAFEKMGPFIYEVTTTREVLEFNETAGTVTYSEYDSFEWCENCMWTDEDGTEVASVSGDTEITNVNILWNTQRIAGLATGITYGETFAKAGFANAMIENELQNKAPSIWAAGDIAESVSSASAQIQAAMNVSAEVADSMAPAAVLDGAYDGWLAQSGASDASPDFSVAAQSIMFDAADPSTGICIALTCDIGPMLIAGMGEPSEATTATRAALLGYSSADAATLTHIDWAVYALAGAEFLEHGGGADLTTVDDLRQRLDEVSGVDIASPEVLDYLMFGIDPETGLGAGLLTTVDFNGIPLDGVALFLLGAQADSFGTMISYNIGLVQLLSLSNWAGAWIGMLGTPAEFPMILVGGSGTINAQLWWETSFGGVEPIAGGYLLIGLNRAEFEGSIDISIEKTREILYTSDYALTGDFASVFMYNELAGTTMPMNEDQSDFETGGEVVPWDDAFVAAAYDISESEAAALRSWVRDFMFEQVIGALLGFQYGGSAYTTQPVSNWLYGWRDPIVADVVYGDISNMNVGWVSLETNETYFGSDSVSTGDFSVYVMSTGGDTIGQSVSQGYINSDGDGLCDFKMDAGGNAEYNVECEANETYGLTEHLPWRAPHNEEATYGLLSDHVGNTNTVVAGAIGGKSAPLVNDASSPFRLNAVGYAIAESTVVGDVTFKGIEMVEHHLALDPAEHQIQAKLIGSRTYVDVLPGALPVYFSADITMRVEKVSGVVMYGDVLAAFHYDLRGPGSMNPDFSEGSIDTHPVFEIRSFSELDDETAASFRGSVSDNMGPMGWTNFGGDAGAPLSYLTYVIALLYVTAIGLIAYGGREMLNEGALPNADEAE